MNMQRLDVEKFDLMIDELSRSVDRKKAVCNIILPLRSVNGSDVENIPVIERIKSAIQNDFTDNLSVKDIAEITGIRMYYMCHIFKKATGLTVGDYKKVQKLIKAKKLLVSTDKKIGNIAYECAFGSDSYFSKVFFASEGFSPSQYRNYAKHQ